MRNTEMNIEIFKELINVAPYKMYNLATSMAFISDDILLEAYGFELMDTFKEMYPVKSVIRDKFLTNTDILKLIDIDQFLMFDLAQAMIKTDNPFLFKIGNKIINNLSDEKFLECAEVCELDNGDNVISTFRSFKGDIKVDYRKVYYAYKAGKIKPLQLEDGKLYEVTL